MGVARLLMNPLTQTGVNQDNEYSLQCCTKPFQGIYTNYTHSALMELSQVAGMVQQTYSAILLIQQTISMWHYIGMVLYNTMSYPTYSGVIQWTSQLSYRSISHRECLCFFFRRLFGGGGGGGGGGGTLRSKVRGRGGRHE